VSDTNEPTPEDGRETSREAVTALGAKLGRKREFRLPRIPWGVLQIIALVAVFLPVFWVLLYRVIDPPTTILMVQRALQGERIRHQNVKFEDISPHVIRAVLAAEDARFCTHGGFDMESIQAAYESNQKSSNQAKGRVRGGSTISQQTAKNLFLWPDRSFIRKGLEAYFTFIAEHAWDKKRIMTSYLNVAEWGDGVFGIQAAAQARFKVSAGQLTPRQAALLASVLPSPNKWSATSPGPYVRRRAASIEARMYAIHAQGLDSCVLGGYAAPAPRRKPGAAPAPLPQLPALPPDVAADSDAPIMTPTDAAIVAPIDAGETPPAPVADEPALAEPDSAPAAAPSAAPEQ
jgi:monofunctional biosynthetic peptidoglycan transglycosylase